jgi:glycosyltransferase involved in cell wall biosynthesis
MEQSLVSVVMSVFNAEKYLREAIESVLAQTFTNYEFIIINDGSTDSSMDIIGGYNDARIKIITQENKGLSSALNAGIKIASGKYIARLDADDIALSNRMQIQVNFMEQNPEVVLSGSNAYVIDSGGEYLYTSNMPLNEEQILKCLRNTSPFYHSSVIYRKEVFDKCGGYNEKIRHHVEDLILWNKMAQFGKMCNLREPLIKYRLVPGALTNRNKKTADSMINLAGRIIKGEIPSDSEFEEIDTLSKRATNAQKSGSYYANLGCIFLYRRKERGRAFRNFLYALRCTPYKISFAFLTILSLMPAFVVNRWMKFRKIDIT